MHEEYTCPDCDGQGWYVATGYESGCCGGSDWECGARGCTGPIQIEVPIQEQCERCLGTGDIRAALNPLSGEGGCGPADGGAT